MSFRSLSEDAQKRLAQQAIEERDDNALYDSVNDYSHIFGPPGLDEEGMLEWLISQDDVDPHSTMEGLAKKSSLNSSTPLLDGIRKMARFFDIKDVESGLVPGEGRHRLRGDQLSLAKDLIEEQHGKRVGIRHPWRTGIPTLGIWPAISKALAKGEVLDSLSDKYPALEKLRNEALLEDEKLRLQRSMASSQSRMSWRD